MDFITVKEAARKWNLAERSVQNYCMNEKIPGAKSIGKQWLIPADAEQPIDGRSKLARNRRASSPYHFPLFAFSPFFSSQTELNDEETALLDAQSLFLSSHFTECVQECSDLVKTASSAAILFGSHCTVGHAAAILGDREKYLSSLDAMKRLIASEERRKADFRLLFDGLVLRTGNTADVLSAVTPSDLSPDAILYYQYLYIRISFLNRSIEPLKNLRFFLSVLRQTELEGISPAALSLNCMLSSLFERIENPEEARKRMQAACEIAAKNGFAGLLAPYASFQPVLMRDCVSKLPVHDQKVFFNVQSLIGGRS